MTQELTKVSPAINHQEHSTPLTKIKIEIQIAEALFRKASNIPSLFTYKSFKDFNKELQPKAYNSLYSWFNCSNPPEKKSCDECSEKQSDSCTNYGFLLLSPGIYGVGKTHLVCAFLNRQLEEAIKFTKGAFVGRDGTWTVKDYPVHFTTETQLLSRIRNSYRDDSEESEESIYSKLLNYYDFLAIDDVGKTKPRDYSFLQSVYFRLIDAFYTNGENRLILTTNLDFKELEVHLGGATADRLVEMCGPNIIKMAGQSYRTKVRK